MPVGAIIAGAGALASVAGAVIGGNATKKAAQQASDTSLQTATMNNALARDIYTQNQGALAPFMQRGNVAGAAFNELLGLPGAPAAQAPVPANNNGALSSYGGSPMAQNGYYRGDYNASFNGYPDQFHREAMIYDQQSQGPGGFAGTMAPQAGQVTSAAPTQPTARSAFENYLNSSGYQFRLGEGARTLNMGAAANGMSRSGAADKALVRYGQDYGSNEFGRYLGYLGNQQSVGLSGASALAGVGQNYAGMVTANNNSAGETAANAALMRGAAQANMWNGIGGSIGTLAGQAFGGGWWK